MAVSIRLKRVGAKRKPFYRIVIAPKEVARSGGCLEEIGYYNPRTKPLTLHFDRERFDYWIKNGARPTKTIHRLLAQSTTGKS